MAQVVNGGSAAFNNLIFGGPDLNLRNHLAQQFTSAATNLTALGQKLYQESKQMFERFSGDSAIRYLQSVGRTVSAIWQTDTIRYIGDIGAMQMAPMAMQRWIMAEPTVRKMYHEQRLEGYGDSYLDMQPGVSGHDHYDFRRAMNGMIQFNDDENSDAPGWTSTEYFDEPYEDDRELTFDEQVDIQNTWEALRTMLKHGHSDPTSRFNATLD